MISHNHLDNLFRWRTVDSLEAGSLMRRGLDYIFMDDTAWLHRENIVNAIHEEEDIRRMNCLSRSPELNHIQHVWDDLESAISQHCSSPRTLQELKVALSEV
ncbi:hypothetical protein TNCV_4993911 [Trichonephila clavipes]|nr:hypothetical protein TNCV_4993911 [Trichonephila clavipes]